MRGWVSEGPIMSLVRFGQNLTKQVFPLPWGSYQKYYINREMKLLTRNLLFRSTVCCVPVSISERQVVKLIFVPVQFCSFLH